MTYGGSAVAILNPYIGLLIYIGFGILKPERLWIVPVGNYSKVVALSLLAGWVIRGLGRWRFGRSRWTVAALMFLWAWSVLSAAQAANQAVAWAYIDNMSKIYLPFLVGITTIDSVRRLKQLAWVIVISVGYVAFRENELYLQGALIERENLICHMMVTGIAPAFFLGLQVADWKCKVLVFACAILMVHVVLFQFSRGAMLAAIATSGATFLVLPKRPRHYAVFAIALLISLRLAGPQVQERFATIFASEEDRDYSAQSRMDLWKDMAGVALEHPVWGIGPDHWPLVADRYGWDHGKDGHGLWPQTAAELGFPGAVALFLFYATTIARLLPHALARGPAIDPWIPAFSRAVVACLVGFMCGSLFGSMEGMETPYYVALLGAGTLKVADGLGVPGGSG